MPLSIALRIRQAEACEDDREVLERKIFRGQMKPMPIGEGGRSNSVTRNPPVFANPSPMGGRAVRSFGRAERCSRSWCERRHGYGSRRQRRQHLSNNRDRLLRLEEEDTKAGITVALLCRRHLEVDRIICGI